MFKDHRVQQIELLHQIEQQAILVQQVELPLQVEQQIVQVLQVVDKHHLHEVQALQQIEVLRVRLLDKAVFQLHAHLQQAQAVEALKNQMLQPHVQHQAELVALVDKKEYCKCVQ